MLLPRRDAAQQRLQGQHGRERHREQQRRAARAGGLHVHRRHGEHPLRRAAHGGLVRGGERALGRGEALRRGVRRGEQPEHALGERLARVRG